MISESCDIHEFIRKVPKTDSSKVIAMADQEAMEAWRSARRAVPTSKISSASIDEYESLLKDLIYFLRSTIPYRHRKMDRNIFEQFFQLRSYIEISENSVFKAGNTIGL